MYTRQHGVETNLFLAPGEGEEGAAAAAEGQGDEARPTPRDVLGILRE
jgi:hypothetical protein